MLQLVCFGFTLSMFSQNLVPNPSFEEYKPCPEGGGDLFTLNWRVTQSCSAASPDYFNACAAGSDYGVPDNIGGTQEAQYGDAYAGFYQYGQNSFREYITTQLISPLIAGNTYEVSFYLSLPERIILATDNIGAILTNEPLECTIHEHLIEVEPQVTAGYFITSITDWSLVTGTFVANGGEEYITIGNFYSDEDTPTIVANSGGNLPNCYYYVDSVSVTSLLDVNENDLEDQLKVYPNPIAENVNIELANGSTIDSIEIYSPIGQLIKTVNPNETTTMLDLSELSKGVYFLIIKDSNAQSYTQKILKE